MFDRKSTYRIKRKYQENEDTTTLSLTLEGGSVPDFIPGQVIDVFFPETGTALGKAYGITSLPGSDTLDITVKDIGKFSGRLCDLIPGETFTGSAPYGTFYPECGGTNLILLCGGMGVTSFKGIIDAQKAAGSHRKVDLFYSARRNDELIFHESLISREENSRHFKAHFFVTREPTAGCRAAHHRRLITSDILKCTQDPENTEFMICGQPGFTEDIRARLLKDSSIKRASISTSSISSPTEVLL